MRKIDAEDVPAKAARADYFTGAVLQEPIPTVETSPRLHALRVSFQPGARTNWHTLPLGQVLHVISGIGLVQKRSEPAMVIREGDTVVIEPGEEHWHGAAPARSMTHIALQHEGPDGMAATWLEPVTDEDYAAAGG